MANSSSINALYFEILLSKNKLPLLQTYYSEIKNTILTDLTNLYNSINSVQTWVNTQRSSLSVDKSDSDTRLNNFIASSTDALIINHDKYKEMLERYNSYIYAFYSRMHSLETSGTNDSYTITNFVNNELGALSSYWKFHYTSRYNDALPVEHSYAALNFTSESQILELSNNRYIYMTNENVIYDVDYNTKDVYVIYIDPKTFMSQYNASTVITDKLSIVSERTKFVTIFNTKRYDKIFALVDIGEIDILTINEITEYVLGDKNDGSGVHRLIVCSYDEANHRFVSLEDTSSKNIYVTGNILNNEKINIISDFDSQYVYFYTKRVLGRFYLSETVPPSSVIHNMIVIHDTDIFKYDIANMVYYYDDITGGTIKHCLITNAKGNSDENGAKCVAILRIDDETDNPKAINPSTSNKFINWLSNNSSAGTKINHLFKATHVGGEAVENPIKGIYITLTSKFYFITINDLLTKSSNNFSLNEFHQDERSDVIGDLQAISLDDPDIYLIDDFGSFYYLYNHSYLYCAKCDSTGYGPKNNVVQSPTRYADKILNLNTVVSQSQIGYAYTVNNSLIPNDSIIYSFVDYPNDNDGYGIYYVVTKTGKVIYCNLANGSWSSVAVSSSTGSICNSRNIRCYFEDISGSTGIYFVCDKTIYRITKNQIKSGTPAEVIVKLDNGFTGDILCIIYIHSRYSIYFADTRGYVSCVDCRNGYTESTVTIHTRYTGSTSFNDSDKNIYAITDGTNAIGADYYINCITTDGNNLIVMGKDGRVSACSFSNFQWTPYNTDDADINKYATNIFYSGRYETDEGTTPKNADIVSFVNYNNTKLIVFGVDSSMWSCNLVTGVWSNIVGKIVLHGGSSFGPGIYNEGTLLTFKGDSEENDKAPYAVTRQGTTVFVAGGSGRMASINITTGGITAYKNTDESNTNTSEFTTNELTVGPGYSYDGSEFGTSIKNLIIDNNSGQLYMSGDNSTVMTYSIESKEVLIPSSNKLYYISRRRTETDYLSSLMVRVAKNTLTERVPIYPPCEAENVYDPYYKSSQFVYKDGNYIVRLSATLDIVYYSTDNGITFDQSYDVKNFNILPKNASTDILENPVSMTHGAISKNGSFLIALNIGEGNDQSSFILYGGYESGEFYCSWRKETSVLSQNEIDSLQNHGNVFSYRKSEGNLVIYSFTSSHFNEYTIENSNLIAYDESRNLVYVKDENDNLVSYTSNFSSDDAIIITGITEKIKDYIKTVVAKDVTNLYISDMYVEKERNFNFICWVSNNEIIIVTLHFAEVNILDVDGNWSLSSYTIPLKEMLLTNAKSLKTVLYDEDIEIPKINKSSIKTCVSHDGTKGFIVFNFNVNSFKRSVIVSVNSEVFGEHVVFNGRIINVSDSYSRVIDFDRTNAFLNIARYNNTYESGVIKYTNSIHTYKELNAIANSPIRSLSEGWYTAEIKMGTSINAFAIRLKMINDETMSDELSVLKQFTLRYQVLISDVTNGKFIFFEVEKSTGMSKTDDETKSVEPFFRVISCDLFDDEIYELYTSKFDGTKNVVETQKTFGANNYGDLGSYKSRVITSYDFMTYVVRSSTEEAKYQIKIKPLNTLPSSIDACFYIEPYTNDASQNKISSFENNIDTAEYRGITVENSTLHYILNGKKNDDDTSSHGIITKTQTDATSLYYHPQNSNIDSLPLYNGKDNDIVETMADTYLTIVKGRGNGTFDKLNGIFQHSGDNNWKLLPLSYNKKDIRYVFDKDGSDDIYLKETFDVKTASSSRQIHKMHNFSIFSKSIINGSDYHTDYGENGRIVAVEGTLSNKYGLFEAITTIDGNQKRIKQVREYKEGNLWRQVETALDKIKNREYGYGYDIVDHYSRFEDPYDLVKAWWVSNQSKLTKGNERLLFLPYTSTADADIGKKYFQNDKIEKITHAEIEYEGGKDPEKNGIVSSVNGVKSTEKNVAVRELIDEKFPLERWSGFEWADLCFIRRWRITYTDYSIDYLYEIEGPKAETSERDNNGLSTYVTIDHVPIVGTSDYTNIIPKSLREIKPSVRRNIYYYDDNFDVEGVGKQNFKAITMYYYKSHDWVIFKHETIETHFDYDTHIRNMIFDADGNETKEANLYKFNNLARIRQNGNNPTSKWFVLKSNNVYSADNSQNTYLNHSDKQYCVDYLPYREEDRITIKDSFLSDFVSDSSQSAGCVISSEGILTPARGMIGECITNITIPFVDILSHVISVPRYVNLDYEESVDGLLPPGDKVESGYAYIDIYRRGYYKIAEKRVDGNAGNTSILRALLDPSKLGVDYYSDENITISDLSSVLTSLDIVDDDTDDANMSLFATCAHEQSKIRAYINKDNDAESILEGVNTSIRTDYENNTYGWHYGIGDIITSYATSDTGWNTIETNGNRNKVMVDTIQYYAEIPDNKTAITDAKWQVFNVYTETDNATFTISTNSIEKDVNCSNLVLLSDSSVINFERYLGFYTRRYLFKRLMTLTMSNLLKTPGIENVYTLNYEIKWNKFFALKFNKSPVIEYNSGKEGSNNENVTLENLEDLLKWNVNEFKQTFTTDNFFYFTPYNETEEDYERRLDTEKTGDLIYITQIIDEKEGSNIIQNIPPINVTNQRYYFFKFYEAVEKVSVIAKDVNARYMWITINENSIKVNTIGVTADDTKHWMINGTVHYEWTDGSTLTRPLENFSLESLVNSGLITEDSLSTGKKKTVFDSETNPLYVTNIYTITLTGPNLNGAISGSIDKFNPENKNLDLTATYVARYTETTDTTGTGVSGQEVAPESVADWQTNDEYDGKNGVDDTDKTSVESYDIVFTTSHVSVENDNRKAIYGQQYSTNFEAEDGYNVPRSIIVRIGGIQVGTTNYNYNALEFSPISQSVDAYSSNKYEDVSVDVGMSLAGKDYYYKHIYTEYIENTSEYDENVDYYTDNSGLTHATIVKQFNTGKTYYEADGISDFVETEDIVPDSSKTYYVKNEELDTYDLVDYENEFSYGFTPGVTYYIGQSRIEYLKSEDTKAQNGTQYALKIMTYNSFFEIYRNYAISHFGTSNTTFAGWSLDGYSLVTSDKLLEYVKEGDFITFYAVFESKVKSKLTIYGPYITGDVEVVVNAS